MNIKTKILFTLYNLRILKLFPQFYSHYFIKDFIKEGDTVIDIGANWGCYTRLFSEWVGVEGIVYAVEPMAGTIPVYQADNVVLMPFALGNEYKITKMMHYKNSSGTYKINDNGQYFVSMIKGSDLFKGLDRIDFIKIDVEMSELPIIEDMKELIEKHKPIILIETGKIKEVLEITGYKIIEKFQNDYLLQ